jgi:hypothetical protein
MTQVAVFEPPEIRGLWEDALLQAMLFPGGAA